MKRVKHDKKEFEDLEAKLKVILNIIRKYQKEGGQDALRHRIEIFCKCVGSSSCRFTRIPWILFKQNTSPTLLFV